MTRKAWHPIGINLVLYHCHPERSEGSVRFPRLSRHREAKRIRQHSPSWSLAVSVLAKNLSLQVRPSALHVLSRSTRARLHAEQPAYPIHPPDQEYIHCQYQRQRERADDQPLGQDTHVPLHHEEGDHDDRRLMQHIERQHRFVRLRKSFRVEIEPADATGQDEDDPGPGIDAE